MRRWSVALSVVTLLIAAAGLAGGAAAQGSVAVGLSVRTPYILGIYATAEPWPGLLLQGNIGVNTKQQFDINGLGLKASYELIPAVAAVAGYTHYRQSNVIVAGIRYMERWQSLWGYAGVQYQYVLDRKSGNLGLEAGAKLGIWRNYFLGAEGGYRLMEDGTPNLAVYLGCEF